VRQALRGAWRQALSAACSLALCSCLQPCTCRLAGRLEAKETCGRAVCRLALGGLSVESREQERRRATADACTRVLTPGGGCLSAGRYGGRRKRGQRPPRRVFGVGRRASACSWRRRLQNVSLSGLLSSLALLPSCAPSPAPSCLRACCSGVRRTVCQVLRVMCAPEAAGREQEGRHDQARC